MKATKEQKRKALVEKIAVMKRIWSRSGKIERAAECDGSRNEAISDYVTLAKCNRILDS